MPLHDQGFNQDPNRQPPTPWIGFVMLAVVVLGLPFLTGVVAVIAAML